jgi:YD repeat-containing protein
MVMSMLSRRLFTGAAMLVACSVVLLAATASRAQQIGECQHAVVTETTEWGDWHVEADGSQWRDGTVIKEVRCADPGSPHGTKKTTVGKARETKAKNGTATVTTEKKTDKGATVTVEEKDKKGNTTKTTTATYDDKGNVTGVTENDGKKTTEWKKEGDKWYEKKGDKLVEQKKGPKDVPAPLGK